MKAKASRRSECIAQPPPNVGCAERGLTDFFASIGIVASLMGASRKYCTYPVACIALWLEPAIRHNQVHIFRNESGLPIGYMTWAWLAQDTERRFLNDPNVLLHISEWNEGERLWVLDFVLISGNLKKCLNEAAQLFAANGSAKSARRNDNGSIRRVTTWTRTALKNISPVRR